MIPSLVLETTETKITKSLETSPLKVREVAIPEIIFTSNILQIMDIIQRSQINSYGSPCQ
jgi:hypothetical protein